MFWRSVRARSTHWVRAGGPALAFGRGGVSCTGAAAAGADPACGAGPGGGVGMGSGQIGSTAVEVADWPVIVAAAGLAACFRACRGDGGAAAPGGGFAAAAAATPGKTGPEGSGFMMLTAGMEAALGKSILTTLRAPGPLVEAVAVGGACAPSEIGPSDPAPQIAA